MSLFNAYMRLFGAIDGSVVRDEKLSRHTTLHVGGPAALFITCNTYTSLADTLQVLQEEHVSWVVLGRGSNVVVSDSGYMGCVILLGREFTRAHIEADGERVRVGAGMVLTRFLTQLMNEGLAGLEFCVGIPGTVGGAVACDVMFSKKRLCDAIESIIVYRPGKGLYSYAPNEIDWEAAKATNTSPFAGEVILEVIFHLRKTTRTSVAQMMENFLTRRKIQQSMGQATCGSVWRDSEDVHPESLIAKCGLRGYVQGGAHIDSVHPTVIINDGHATSADVMQLIEKMYRCVDKQMGIQLDTNVKFLGFSS